MMPPFPSPSLKFRKAGFPRSGFKASISDRAFPSDREFVAALGLRPSFVLSASTVEFPVLCRRNVARLSTADSSSYRCSTPGALAPVRVILSRSIITYRPHPPHLQAHLDFAA